MKAQKWLAWLAVPVAGVYCWFCVREWIIRETFRIIDEIS